MTDPDPVDTQNWKPDDVVPDSGWYLAFDARTRNPLGRRYYDRHDRFECWPRPPGCAIVWSGRPVSPILPGESEQPGRVPDDAAVAD
jgi:hypothetical protein